MTIYRISNCIIEVVVDEGTDAGGEHLVELKNAANSMDPVPVALLINRKYDYSIRLSVLLEALKKNPFKFVAMVDNNRAAQFIPPSLWPKFVKKGVFNDRQSALNWLESKLSELLK